MLDSYFHTIVRSVACPVVILKPVANATSYTTVNGAIFVTVPIVIIPITGAVFDSASSNSSIPAIGLLTTMECNIPEPVFICVVVAVVICV